MPPASVAIHLCIGSVYAWSIYNPALVKTVGITSLREHSMRSSVEELVAKIDPTAFERAFGAGLDQLDLLLEQNTVTIAKLMATAPPGTIDPTSSLYNTMYLMAGLLAIALVSNALMRPVANRHLMRESVT